MIPPPRRPPAQPISGTHAGNTSRSSAPYKISASATPRTFTSDQRRGSAQALEMNQSFWLPSAPIPKLNNFAIGLEHAYTIPVVKSGTLNKKDTLSGTLFLLSPQLHVRRSSRLEEAFARPSSGASANLQRTPTTPKMSETAPTAPTMELRNKAADMINAVAAQYAERARSRGVILKTDGLNWWTQHWRDIKQ